MSFLKRILKKDTTKSVPIEKQLRFIDNALKKILQAKNLVKDRKSLKSLKSVSEMFIRFNILQTMKRNLMLNHISAEIWDQIPVEYFVRERKNLHKTKIQKRFSPDKRRIVTDLQTKKPIKSLLSPESKPLLTGLGLEVPKDHNHVKVDDETKLEDIHTQLFSRWSNQNNELVPLDYQIFNHLLNSKNVKVPMYIKENIGDRIYEKAALFGINSNLVTKNTNLIEKNDLVKVYMREFLKLFVEYQTKHGNLAPYYKKDKKVELKEYTKSEWPIVEKAKDEIETAIINELIARKQYIVDSKAYTGADEIRSELMVHSEEENGHFRLLSSFFDEVPEKAVNTKIPKFSPSGKTDLEILEYQLKGEQDAVVEYQTILNKIGIKHKDSAVYQIISKIKADEEEHVVDILKFIKVNKGKMKPEDLRKYLLPNPRNGFGLLNKFNRYTSLDCEFTDNPVYLFKGSHRVIMNQRTTLPVCTYSIINGFIKGRSFLENMESVVKNSKVIIFLPLVKNVEEKFSVRPLLLSYEKLNKLIVKKKKFKKIAIFCVKHYCSRETFNITYVLDPLDYYPEEAEIRIYKNNDFFVNVFRNNFDWAIKKAYGSAIYVLNRAYNESKNNHITRFNILKTAYSLMFKNVLYESFRDEELKMDDGNVFINRIAYCTSLLTILQSHFNKPFLDYKVVAYLLHVAKTVFIRHLWLILPKRIPKCIPEVQKEQTPQDFYRKFLLVRWMVSGPTYFSEKVKAKRKDVQPELMYILKALEDPFISTLFNIDCYVINNKRTPYRNKIDKWYWKGIDQFIKNKGFLKEASGIVTESLTQDSFDDVRIKAKDKPIKITLDNLVMEHSCQVINECTFPVIKTTNQRADISVQVKFAKKTAFEKQKDLLKIDDSFHLYSRNNAEKLFKELFIQQALEDIEDSLIGGKINENEKDELKSTCNKLMESSENDETREKCQKILSIIK
jgi:bacterioferritin (cytochrome b1)